MPVRHAYALFKAADEPKELWIVPDVHHVGARDLTPGRVLRARRSVPVRSAQRSNAAFTGWRGVVERDAPHCRSSSGWLRGGSATDASSPNQPPQATAETVRAPRRAARRARSARDSSPGGRLEYVPSTYASVRSWIARAARPAPGAPGRSATSNGVSRGRRAQRAGPASEAHQLGVRPLIRRRGRRVPRRQAMARTPAASATTSEQHAERDEQDARAASTGTVARAVRRRRRPACPAARRALRASADWPRPRRYPAARRAPVRRLAGRGTAAGESPTARR